MPQTHEACYGLPSGVRFCQRCLTSNQRPASAVEFRHTIESKKTTLAFDEEDIWDACRVAEQKELIDWRQRQEEDTELPGNDFDAPMALLQRELQSQGKCAE